jgi:uncharacterized protein YyaL (SSP411 family)
LRRITRRGLGMEAAVGTGMSLSRRALLVSLCAALAGCGSGPPSARDAMPTNDGAGGSGDGASKNGDGKGEGSELPGAPKIPKGGPDPNSAWRKLADETHGFVVGHLLAPSGSYKTTEAEDRTDQWHCVSQIGADIEMVRLGDGRYLPYAEATFTFMNKLWDGGNTTGGYFATSKADGSNVETSTKYVDDNSLAGVTWLDAHEALTDPGRKAAYLASARSVANWLMYSGTWDTTYGGGFWWSTQKPDKPTQSNALALRVFTRLAAIGSETHYKDWATSIVTWLDGTMLDQATGLYAWKYEAGGRNGAKFTYDQAIMIEALLDLNRLADAQKLADAMHTVLWDVTSGGYVISTEDHRLSPVFSAWASVALVRLFETDQDPKWLDRAVANADALGAKLRDATNHGYYATSKPDGSERSPYLQAVDQAWMQRAQAAIARHR